MITLLSVNTAPVGRLHIQGRSVASAIGKQPRTGRVAVHALGLAHDEQADPQWHGGLRKAVYAYPHAHYAWWQTQRHAHAVDLFDQPLPPGFMGENLTLDGLLEADVYVGDTLHFPDCSLRVTEPRQPCFKFVHIMGYAQAARDMVTQGCCGWYLEVVRPGSIEAGASATLVPGPRQTPITQLLRRRRSND